MDKEDLEIKKNLAYAYQILAKLGMDDHTYTHLSARPNGADYYYIFPFGMRFEEVTADNLLKVSLGGEVLDGSELQYNKTGYIIHGNIYKKRQDLNAIFHLHTIASVAVSSMKRGLLQVSQWALHFYNNLAYHDYDALSLNAKQGGDLADDLADKNILIMRNHGFIAGGKTIHEAMFYCYHFEQACKAQIAILSSGEELIIPSDEICKKAYIDIMNFEQDLGIRDWKAWVRFLGK